MMVNSGRGTGRASLQNGLDREVNQIIDKYLEQQPDLETIRTSDVYDWIKRSNSSLKRKPKPVLEKSIERVLAVLEDDAGDDEDEMDPIEGDFVGTDAIHEKKKPREVNDLVTKSWNTSKAAALNGDRSDSKKRSSDLSGPPRKRQRSDNKVDTSPPSHVKLEDVGGVDAVKQQLKEHLVMPLLRPKEYEKRKIPIPRGILLHGPPGCGKTAISRAFAAKIGVPFVEILGPSVVSGMSGESEKQIREHFDKAKEVAPCLMFIDEIDVIAPKRDNAQSQMEKRIVAQLLISMDSLAMEANEGKPVIVLAATNRPDSIDPALRRGGRFDTEINMGVPNEATRALILKALTRETMISDDVSFETLAKRTAGFVGADLRDLVGKAGTWSMDRYREALEQQAADTEPMEIDEANNATDRTQRTTLSAMDRSIDRLIWRLRDSELPDPPGFETAISMAAFEAVLPGIQPSSKREGFAVIPDTTWDDVGALDAVREELKMAIVEPIKNPARFKNVGITAPTGVLLWGPPGCGKTLVAKAVANESKANFISVKGPELLNKYVGESELKVRQLFARARSSVPCVIFFDELDALVPRRNDALSEASARVVNTLLTELDGLSAREGIYVVGATNRPDIIDEAMLRPGRLETLLFVGLPKAEERVAILRALMKKTPIDPSLADIALTSCDQFSGADLASLLRQAGRGALRRVAERGGAESVEKEDLEVAVSNVRRSVSDEQVKVFERLRKQFGTHI